MAMAMERSENMELSLNVHRIKLMLCIKRRNDRNLNSVSSDYKHRHKLKTGTSEAHGLIRSVVQVLGKLKVLTWGAKSSNMTGKINF